MSIFTGLGPAIPWKYWNYYNLQIFEGHYKLCGDQLFCVFYISKSAISRQKGLITLHLYNGDPSNLSEKMVFIWNGPQSAAQAVRGLLDCGKPFQWDWRWDASTRFDSACRVVNVFNSLRPSDAYMRRYSLGTNFSEILIKIHTFSFKEMPLKMSSANWWPFCLGLNVLNTWKQEIVMMAPEAVIKTWHVHKAWTFTLCWTQEN